MNLTKSPEKVQDIAILGDQVHLSGYYHSDGTVIIQGEFQGSIDSVNIVVTRHGQLKASIHSKSLEIWGDLDGFAQSEKVICRSSSHIKGVVMSNGIAIEPGTIIGGGLTFHQAGESSEK